MGRCARIHVSKERPGSINGLCISYFFNKNVNEKNRRGKCAKMSVADSALH